MGIRIAMFLVGCVLGVVPLPTRPQAAPLFETTQLSERLYTFRYQLYRTFFLVTAEGVIVSDPLNPTAARLLRQEIAKVTNQPVKYVIYSHQHWDHTRGGQIFKDEGARFVSHVNCLKHFYMKPHPEVLPPDETVRGNSDFTFGGETIQLMYFGPNHGDCLLVFGFAAERMIFLVDLVTPGYIGLGYLPDYDPPEYIRSLKEIEALDFDEMVGGHGPARAPKSAVTERRRWLETIMAAVKRELDAGTPRGEIAAKLDFPEFKHLAGYEGELPRYVDRVVSFYNMGW